MSRGNQCHWISVWWMPLMEHSNAGTQNVGPQSCGDTESQGHRAMGNASVGYHTEWTGGEEEYNDLEAVVVPACTGSITCTPYMHGIWYMVRGKAFSALYLGREKGFSFTLLMGRHQYQCEAEMSSFALKGLTFDKAFYT